MPTNGSIVPGKNRLSRIFFLKNMKMQNHYAPAGPYVHPWYNMHVVLVWRARNCAQSLNRLKCRNPRTYMRV